MRRPLPPLSRSTVVGDFGALKSTGAGQTMGLNYSHYLPPDGGYRSYVTLGLDDKRFDVTEIAGVPVPTQLVRRSRPLSLGYTAKVESDSAVWGYNTELIANLVGGGLFLTLFAVFVLQVIARFVFNKPITGVTEMVIVSIAARPPCFLTASFEASAPFWS